MAGLCLKTCVASLIFVIFCSDSNSVRIDQGSEVATFQYCPGDPQPVFVNLYCTFKLTIISSTPLVEVLWKDITTTPSVDVVTISNSTTVTKTAAYQHLEITRLTNGRLDGSIRLQIENISPGSAKIFSCEASAVNDNPGWTSRPVVVYNNATCFQDNCQQNDPRRVDTMKVAFTAAMNTNIGPTQEPLVLIFQNVITNIGRAYNPVSGEFVTPVPGVYIFNYHILAQFYRPTEVVLRLNDKFVNSVHSRQTGGYTGVSNSAVLSLQKGDIITLTLSGGTYYRYYVYGLTGLHTTFTGYLLYPE